MAIYHLHASTGTRGTGQSARAKYLYITRHGRYAHDAGECMHVESGNMPEWASNGYEEYYWLSADKSERSNGRLFKEVTVALPVEFSSRPNQRLDLVRDYVNSITSNECLPYTFAIHAGKGHNPHLHLIVSERCNDGLSRGADVWFKRVATGGAPPEEGGARKSCKLKPKSWLEQTRKRWAQLTNAYLMAEGFESRIDHRTLKQQGICRDATQHLGPVAAAMEKRGVRTERGSIALKAAALSKLSEQIVIIDEEIKIMETAIEKLHQRRKESAEKDKENKRKSTVRKHENESEHQHQRRVHLAITGEHENREKASVEHKKWRESYQAKLWREHYGSSMPDSIRISYIDLAGKDGVKIKLSDNEGLVDTGDTIHARNGSDDEITAMLTVAKAKGWKKVRFSGTDSFRRRSIEAAIRDGSFEIDWEGSQMDPSEFQNLLPSEQQDGIASAQDILGARTDVTASPKPSSNPAKKLTNTKQQNSANDDGWDDFAEELRAGTRGPGAEESLKKLKAAVQKKKELAKEAADQREKALEQTLDESGVTERHTRRAFRPGRS